MEFLLLNLGHLGHITSSIKVVEDLRKLYLEGKVSFVEMRDLRMLVVFSAFFLLERGVPISRTEISVYANGDSDDWEL